ncbi:tRNA (adenosine(37)-N6)-threonylcarbamoyltransferase complex dimerization subunit type 1 TsaB [Brachybacterium phenoliresistens]|uniref:tRNA (adenosine(37)-N6)-threonylcarbamoyltransferase complex dimerization subunit type 1 TsaB n=1 Tax=Brachybacterium phenoliresistens TaxID=396014 RepID=UPI0031D39B42
MLLGIDTSGAVSVALVRAEGTGLGTAAAAAAGAAAGAVAGSPGPEVLAVRSDARARHHDEVLLTLVDEVLAEAGAARTDLTGVVAGRGPGPFTGLRVGLVVARTIAAALDIPLYGVCSLDALALQALTAAGPAPEGRSIAVALDARRREVYWARYRADAEGAVVRVEGPAVSAPAEVCEALFSADLLVGSGTELYPDLLPATARIPHVDAGALVAVAARLAAQGEDLSDTEPMYLREPDAAKPSVRKSALGLGDRPSAP